RHPLSSASSPRPPPPTSTPFPSTTLFRSYVNDSDLIGTHSRLQLAVNLTDWMAGEGAAVTNPNLDLDDFMGISFTTGPDGKVYQDRKSTRLNSSHVKISYAVFCLKKEKKV